MNYRRAFLLPTILAFSSPVFGQQTHNRGVTHGAEAGHPGQFQLCAEYPLSGP